ncbi:unnamed protein product [Adineta ricciae]|uniref:Uncharacterized protein n=1 Tax=Adineta ricciae TaxID=249248 RepID=A0A816BAA7_ADIRI|nr:unnamed protein product [Adineta ricciae]
MDRIRCIAFHEAQDAGATFINRNWIAEKIHRSVWVVRRPNYQNDRIWAKSIDDIEEDERYPEIVKNQACIGFFVIFTAKKLHWVIKDEGESWAG